MSTSVQTSEVHLPLNSLSYFRTFSENSENVFHNSTISVFDSYPTMHHQLSTFTSMPWYEDYKQVANEKKCIAADWLNQACVETCKLFVNSKNNFNALGNVSELKNPKQESNEKFINPDKGSKSKIWRPFSPPLSCRMQDASETSVHKQNSKTINRNQFFSIKPSNVKIGHSKTSVFKAVKKNSFACTQCSSRYLSNRQLNTHLRVHTGSKPFRCEYPNCFKSFARNEELTRHKRIHSGYKPHLCTICKKRFGRKDHLSKHLKTHLQTSEKKMYQCSFPGCGHRYTRSDALTRHKSTAHSIKSQK